MGLYAYCTHRAPWHNRSRITPAAFDRQGRGSPAGDSFFLWTALPGWRLAEPAGSIAKRCRKLTRLQRPYGNATTEVGDLVKLLLTDSVGNATAMRETFKISDATLEEKFESLITK